MPTADGVRQPVKTYRGFSDAHGFEKHELEPPRFERREKIYFVGLEERHAMATSLNVLGQWQRFTPCVEDIPSRMGAAVYGVTLAFDPAMEVLHIFAQSRSIRERCGRRD